MGSVCPWLYLFATVDAVLAEDRSAACGHPDSSQRVAVNFIFLNHSLAFLVLKEQKRIFNRAVKESVWALCSTENVSILTEM